MEPAKRIHRMLGARFCRGSSRLYSTTAWPSFLQAEKHGPRTALIDQHGEHTYNQLYNRAHKLTDKLQTEAPAGKRVTYLCANDASYVVSQWAVSLARAAGVPLCQAHPPRELEYFMENSQASAVVSTEEFAERVESGARKLGIKHIVLSERDYLGDSELLPHHVERANELKDLAEQGRLSEEDAIFVYTSGTTGRPKGVVHTWSSLQGNIGGMLSEWGWSADDVILHVLPLHHVHGIFNVLLTPLQIGAKVVMLPKFDAKNVWRELLGGEGSHGVNLFMAVPTVYKLLEEYRCSQQDADARLQPQHVRPICTEQIRLMVSGSSALPRPVLEQWRAVTGHTLLERYGMTETGMALTQPLAGNRPPGSVGYPFPNNEVCIASPSDTSDTGYDVIAHGDNQGTKETAGLEGQSGELYVRGQNLFRCYWNRPESTKESFTQDGWFKTGDTAQYKDGAYSILGRTSVDIIKSGGYKISALAVERFLLEHPDIHDVAILGVPDPTWGQRVAAVVVLKEKSSDLTLEELREWGKDKMPSYWLPSSIKVLDSMPRNPMGKVNKKDLLAKMFPEEA